MVLALALLGLAIALFQMSQLLFGRETQKIFFWLRAGEQQEREDNHDR